MFEHLAAFHFLRPEFLLGLLFCPLLWLALRQRQKLGHDWAKAIDPKLLAHLTPKGSVQAKSLRAPFLPFIFALSFIAVSGPTWEEKPVPVMQIQDNMVVIMDLSLSMFANDIKPNRLTRAKQKLQDLLLQRREGNTSLVAFSGDSHVVTPLTDDTNTIIATLPALDPYLMPTIGSRPERAIDSAIALFEQAGTATGRIVLITDGVEAHHKDRIDELLSGTRYTLNVLAVGTESGGPVPLKDGTFLKDQGTVVIPKTDISTLRALAQDNGGQLVTLSLDDNDLEQLDVSAERLSADIKEETKQANQERFDSWEDMGYLALLALIPLVLLANRQGALLLLLIVIFPAEKSHALSWDDLWLTPDQQAQKKLQAGDLEGAAQLFESPQHKAYAAAKSGQFEDAVKSLSQLNSAEAHYNRANALAHTGELEDAIAAYDQALDLAPDFEDAQYNKAIIEELLKQQQEQEQQNQDSQNQDGQGQEGQDQQNGQQNDQQEGQESEQNQSQSESQQSQQSDEEKTAEEQERQAAEQEKAEEQAAAKAQQEQAEENEQEQNGEETEGVIDQLSTEDQQSFEQWMRRVPDDPGGLLRRKFEQQSRDRQRIKREEGEPLW